MKKLAHCAPLNPTVSWDIFLYLSYSSLPKKDIDKKKDPYTDEGMLERGFDDCPVAVNVTVRVSCYTEVRTKNLLAE